MGDRIIFMYFDLTGTPEQVFRYWADTIPVAAAIREDMREYYYFQTHSWFKETYLMWRYPHLKLK